jgi:hypothetical protein
MPNSLMDNPFALAVAGAGFTPVENDVVIPNMTLPFLTLKNGTMSIREPLPTDLLRPWEKQPHPKPKLSLLHFSLLGCEPCHEEVSWLHSFAKSEKMPRNMQFLQVVYGTNATQLVADEMTPLLPDGAKTHLDLDDGLAERLGVVGAPSLILVDEAGLVVGYRNSGSDFDNPGFDVFASRIKTWEKLSNTAKFRASTFHTVVNRKVVELPKNETRQFLENIPMVWILLGISIALCYPFLRSNLRRLRKFLSRSMK